MSAPNTPRAAAPFAPPESSSPSPTTKKASISKWLDEMQPSTTTAKAAQAQAAESAATQAAASKVQAIEASHPNLLTTFATAELWPRYCTLFPGPRATPQVRSLTAMSVNDRGFRGPVHEAPESWLEAVEQQLARLLGAAREERHELILGAMETPGYEGQNVHSLLAEEVVWVINQGSLKGKRAEIGVLLECVGVESMGTFWKG